MLLRNILLLILLSPLSLTSWSQEFIASKDIQLTLPKNPIVIHSGESVLFKYPDWVLSHEILNPNTFYRGVDLTGQLQRYVRNIFEPKEGDLPKWLEVMAQDQASVFKVTNDNTTKSVLKGFTLYSVFDAKEENGHIFLVGNDYISHFNVLSKESQFQDFLQLLEGSI